MTKEEKKNFKEVDKAFQKIQYCFSSIKWGRYGEEYFALCLKEEKAHLRGKPEGIFHGLTVSQGAKLFFVQYLIKFLYFKEKLPTIKDVLTCRPSWIFAGTLAENYPDEIRKALEDVNIDLIHSLDYAELVKEDNEKTVNVI